MFTIGETQIYLDNHGTVP